MHTARGMVGMPVVCREKKIGRMIRADVSDDLSHMEGIWLDAGLRGTRYVPAERVEMLGNASIIVDTPGVRKPMKAGALYRRAVSTDGRRLGAITNARIDELSFAVTALELSAGVWDDLFNQRSYFTRFTVNRETGEVIVEPS